MLGNVTRWTRTPGGVVAVSLLLTVVLAAAANLTLDLWQVDDVSRRPLDTSVVGRLPLFLLGSLVIWLFVILLVALTGRLWISAGAVAVVTVLLAFANHRKQELLREPLYPSDLAYLSDPGFLVEMAGLPVVLALLAMSAALFTAAVAAGRWLGRRCHRPALLRHRRGGVLLTSVRLAGIVTAVAGIAYLMDFHRPGNLVKIAYDDNGAHWRPWHQSANYVSNGFVAGMLYNLPMPAMRRPPGYGPATMRALATKYAGIAERINRHRRPDGLRDVNVVFLLGETFTDPSDVPGVRLATDPIPFTRALMQRTTSGRMWSPQYGGGTANVEFEALTGMSMAHFRPQLSTPYQMLVPNYDDFPSSVDVLERHGLRTFALHSFTSALYRRAEVYPALGFADAAFVEEMAHRARLEDNPYTSDRATYAEVLTRLRRADRPMFLHAVSMQNHYPMAGLYRHPIPATGLPDAEATHHLEHYARGLRYSDDAMRYLIGALEKSAEKTVLVFYGDHLPPLWPPSALTERTAHQTAFFVYANFGRHAAERLPTTSPVHFMTHVLELADAPVSPYHALLRTLEKQLPAMGQGVLIGPDDQRLSSSELSPRARRLLRDYRLVQYDLAVGRRYAEEALLEARPTD
ncbi:MAG: LTA synthase family protein [Nocardioidaceae bacterium]